VAHGAGPTVSMDNRMRWSQSRDVAVK
jgi:hypothetical protein